ncbi:MAG: hypothetical protein J6386_11345 [Candidatus Synoicihabitans palmerolidicus]|nr:hypothetical protein [Candidatus Synoicihabitans palmerolidicus]
MTSQRPSNTGIAWLASYPKSGNTWWRLLLQHLFNPELTTPYPGWSHIELASSRRILKYHSGLNPGDLTDPEIDELKPRVLR